MATPLTTHRLAQTWLKQFPAEDRGIASTFLDSLRLVPFAEFEEAIAHSIKTILDKTKGRVAVFPVDKNLDAPDRKPSSADKIGYSLTNLARLYPRRIRVKPSLELMRTEKMTHVVLVDDICGSGRRVEKFWNQWATKTLKSWLSYHACSLWVVAFATHENGVERILDRISYLTPERILTTLSLPPQAEYPVDAVYRLCDQYGQQTGKSKAARGVGGTMSPVIFEHGCPNNAPAILWAAGRNWHPLFPSRGIPPELYPCFGDTEDGTRNAEILWKSGQYKLALEIINTAQLGKNAQQNQLLLTLLGLLAKQVSADRLPALLTVSEAQVKASLNRARRFGFIDGADKLTHFGRDFLKRARKNRRDQDRTILSAQWAIAGYYPSQYFGVQRNI